MVSGRLIDYYSLGRTRYGKCRRCGLWADVPGSVTSLVVL